MKQSKATLTAYNKCQELAVRWQNILDSFYHKDEGIIIKTATETATHYVLTFSNDVVYSFPKNGGSGGTSLTQAQIDAIAAVAGKLDKVQPAGVANRRFVIAADGTVSVAPELGHLQNVEFVDGADPDSKKDTLKFTFVGGSIINVDVKDLFDIGAFSAAAKAGSNTINFTTIGGTTVALDLSDWFKDKWEETLIPYVQGTTYKSRASVIREGKIWRINQVVALPFQSTDFAAERLAGKWDLIGASFPPVVVKSMSVTSIAPNTTLDIIFKGSYFTPDTFVTIQNITVNNNVFIDDNTFKINVTTAANAQLANNLDVTINNGVAKVIPQKMAISVGTTYIPDVEGMAKFVLDASAIGKVFPFSGGIRNEFGSNSLKIAHVDFIVKGDFEISFKHTLNNNGENRVGYLGLAEKTKTITTQTQIDYYFQFGYNWTWYYDGSNNISETIDNAANYTFKIKRVGKDVQFLRDDNVRKTVNLQDETKELKLWFLFSLKTTVEDIKITLF